MKQLESHKWHVKRIWDYTKTADEQKTYCGKPSDSVKTVTPWLGNFFTPLNQTQIQISYVCKNCRKVAKLP